MQRHQIDLAPGESVRVGGLIVTLISVHGKLAEFQVEDEGDGGQDGWKDPVCDLELHSLEPVLA